MPPIINLLEKPFRFCDLEEIVVASLHQKVEPPFAASDNAPVRLDEVHQQTDNQISHATTGRIYKRPPYFPLIE